MKNVRNWVSLVGMTMVAFALCATGARAQAFSTTNFAGTFTLPVEAQWGNVALQPGNYELYYGLLNGSTPTVEVVGKEHGTPHAMILVQGIRDVSTNKSSLVCVRDGSALIVRVLEMPQIDRAVQFNMPRGARLMAKQSHGKKNVQMAEGPKLIERIPITLASR